jgi:large subunit ribosomal protein L6
MSRIGKRPVTVASGIEVSLDGTTLVAKKGNLEKRLETHGRVDVNIDGNEVTFLRKGDEKQDAAFWGTYRALFNNIIIGLDKGFTKSLEINGVGYRAAVQGKVLNLQLGHSHDINFNIPEGLEIKVANRESCV